MGSVETSGFLDFDVKEAEVARAMIAQARSITVRFLPDRSKFGRGGLIKIAPLSAVARVVAESEPPGEIASALKEAGVTVVVA